MGKKFGIVHIYNFFPNHTFAIESNEGFTCVDDVFRATVMLSKYLKLYGDDSIVEKCKTALNSFYRCKIQQVISIIS